MSDKKHRHADACESENAEMEAFGNKDGKSLDEKALNGKTPEGKASEGNAPNVNDPAQSEAENAEKAPSEAELKDARDRLEKSEKQCADYLDRLQRLAAEYDNFKKRSVKEKEALYIDAVSEVAGAFLPVMDNVERALKAISADGSAQTLKDGVEMVFKQFGEVLKNIGIEEIKAVGEQFDPMRHNAVMHVEDESLGQNVIAEEFQKGYVYKDRVIRYSMVKVAN